MDDAPDKKTWWFIITLLLVMVLLFYMFEVHIFPAYYPDPGPR